MASLLYGYLAAVSVVLPLLVAAAALCIEAAVFLHTWSSRRRQSSASSVSGKDE